MELDANFWESNYQNQQTGWDIGYAATPIKEYIDQLQNKNLKILIPGAGNAYEVEYLFKKGFKNVFLMDIAESPINNFKKRLPEFEITAVPAINDLDFSSDLAFHIKLIFFEFWFS